jgi:hypothetical protein
LSGEAEAGVLEHQRDLVDRIDVGHGHDSVTRHVGEESDLLLQVGVNRPLRPADDRVRLDTDRAQRLHRVLRGFRLHLLAVDHRHE